MPKQPAIPGLRDAIKKKVTRREILLPEMDAVVPWRRLLALIGPHHPKMAPKGGRPRCRWKGEVLRVSLRLEAAREVA